MIKFILLVALFCCFVGTNGILINYILFEYNIHNNEEVYEKVFKICLVILLTGIILSGLGFLFFIFAAVTQV